MAGSQDEKINYKVFNDPVHGSIQVHPLAVCIIDTPLFQRLRYLKQLGGVCHVYPGGTHTRFEHSIGVYHLAGKVVNALKDNQPELEITKKQAMCVQLAGLCHDLGHGPFSHLFEIVANELLENREKWTHEDQSERIMDYLFKKENELWKEFERRGYGDAHLQMIKDMIRGKEKGFLYEIVSNSENGMDVDKWDYFARDAYHLGMKTNFEHDRLIFHFKVLPEDQSGHICVRDKEQFAVFTMFATRYALHKTAYKHPVTKGVEMMIKEALVLAAPHLKFAGKSLLDALDDMEAYTKLHDGIYHMILNDTRPELSKAKELLERIEKRDLWKCVGQLVPKTGKDEDEDRATAGNNQHGPTMEELDKSRKKLNSEAELEKLRKKLNEKVTGDLVKVWWVKNDFGSKEENPLDKIRFFNKEGEPVKPGKLLIAPNEYLSKGIRVYWTGPKEGLTDEIQDRITRVLREQDGFRLTYGHD